MHRKGVTSDLQERQEIKDMFIDVIRSEREAERGSCPLIIAFSNGAESKDEAGPNATRVLDFVRSQKRIVWLVVGVLITNIPGLIMGAAYIAGLLHKP